MTEVHVVARWTVLVGIQVQKTITHRKVLVRIVTLRGILMKVPQTLLF